MIDKLRKFSRFVRPEVPKAHEPVEPSASELGDQFVADFGKDCGTVTGAETKSVPGELEQYFDANETGPGIWKWRHYFPAYERHFSKFRGRPVNILEIGVYSGGSLRMWKQYFGDQCQLFGVDMLEACKAYEGPGMKVIIGDQQDRAFWRKTLQDLPPLDIIIDDGGHQPEQQRVTLEEVLPHMRMGGVYLCEDIHGQDNDFATYALSLARGLHAYDPTEAPANTNNGMASNCTNFQRQIQSVHFYPFVTVIEKLESETEQLIAPKRGSEWLF